MKNYFMTAALLLGTMTLSSSCVVRVNTAQLREKMGLEGDVQFVDVFEEDMTTKEFALDVFDDIYSKGNFDVSFVYADEPKAEITAGKDLIDFIEVTQDGRSVTVALDRRVKVSLHGNKTKVCLYSPAVRSISLAGSGSIDMETVHESSFSAALAGSGDINIGDLECDEAQFTVAGSGDINVRESNVKSLKSTVAGSGDVILCGHADSFEGGIAGSGNIDIRNLDCDSVEAGVKGSGKVLRK